MFLSYRISGLQIISLFLLMIQISGCSKQGSSSSTVTQSYSFTSDTNVQVTMTNNFSLLGEISPRTVSTGPVLCSSVVCFSATSLTGEYYGIGFSIQSNGNGMVAYFGQSSWADITSASPTYHFDASSPVVNSGTLVCCNGSGDLSSENTYIESAIYLFAYLDASFTLANITGNTTMNNPYTLRFVFADGAISTALRGDVLIKDANLPAGQGGSNDGLFKWVSLSTGALSTTRPSDPVTMNSSITNYTNPFGPGAGNQSIPVIYAGVTPVGGTGLFTITESDLRIANRTYSFSFDPTNLIMFPTLINSGSDINFIFSVKELMKLVHLGGLPHSQQTMGVGSPASTVLTVTGP